MSMVVSSLPPGDGDGGSGARPCDRCEGPSSEGREIRPGSTGGAALGLSRGETAYLCAECLGRLERILAGWNR